MPTTPRHWTGRRALLSIPHRAGHSVALAAEATATRWTPLPLDAQDVAAQARRELQQLAQARQGDAWAGTRDTDRSL